MGVPARELFERVRCTVFGLRLGFYHSADGSLTIRIEARREDSKLLIDIEDDGVGITRGDLKKLFVPGFGKGLGIGLHNVNERLIALYGEDYRLEISSKVGKGTKVVVKIPATEVVREAKSANCG